MSGYPRPGNPPTTFSLPFTGNPVLTGIAAANYTYCAVSSGAEVLCFGEDTYGQTGTGSPFFSIKSIESTPVFDTDLVATTAVSIGDWHVCSVADDGAIRCWGGNFDGQVGILPIDTTVPTPIAPVGTPLSGVDDIAPFQFGMCVVTDGEIRCSGTGTGGRSVPVRPPASTIGDSTR